MNSENSVAKHVLVYICVCVCSMLLIACNNNSTEMTGVLSPTNSVSPTVVGTDITGMKKSDVDTDRIDFDDEQAMKTATHLIVVKYRGMTSEDSNQYYLFEPIRVLKGELEGEENDILYAIASGGSTEVNVFSTEEVYLLCMEKHISVFQKHSVFIFYPNKFVGTADNWDAMLETAMQIAKSTSEDVPAFYGNTFIASNRLEDIVAFASSIFVIEANQRLGQSPEGLTETFLCTVVRTIRSVPEKGSTIYLAVPYGQFEVGKSYMVFLADASKTAPVYTLASREGSIYSLEDAMKIDELIELLETENEPTKSVDVTKPIVQDDRILLSSDEAMTLATHIMVATCLGTDETDGVFSYRFHPNRVIKGTLDGIDAELIYVEPEAEDTKTQPVFVQGTKYLLSLEKHISVHFAHNRYVALDPFFAQDVENWEELLLRADQIGKETAGKGSEYYGSQFTESADPDVIAEFASNIFIVRIDGITSKEYADSQNISTYLYKCTVLKTYRNLPTFGSQISMTLAKNSVTVGGTYVVLLADATKTAPIYLPASKGKSVYSVDEVEDIPVLAAIVRDAVEYAGN